MIAFLIIKTIILLGLAGYQIIITILALRALLPSYLSYPARHRCTQICVYPRVFMMLNVAQFSLKIAHLSFSMGPRGPRAYGLCPRLWLLIDVDIAAWGRTGHCMQKYNQTSLQVIRLEWEFMTRKTPLPKLNFDTISQNRIVPQVLLYNSRKWFQVYA